MANKLVTPLRINNVFTTENCLVAQGDIMMIGKFVYTIIVEFYQAVYEEYLSSHSKNPSPSCTFREIKLGAPI